MKNKLPKWLADLRNVFNDDITKKVIKSYAKWFIIAIGLAIIAYILATTLNAYCCLAEWRSFLQTSSTILMATALGIRGYDIQTWCGKTPAEKLNQKLFLVFYALGYVILIFSQYLR